MSEKETLPVMQWLFYLLKWSAESFSESTCLQNSQLSLPSGIAPDPAAAGCTCYLDAAADEQVGLPANYEATLRTEARFQANNANPTTPEP